jgi:Ca2+/Na+ antiporter
MSDITPNQAIARRVRKLNRSAAAILLLTFLLGALNPIFIKRTAAIFLSAALALAYFPLRTKIGLANVCLLVLTLLIYGLYVSALFRAA